MSAKVVIPRALADRDVREAIEYYAAQAGTEVALAFVDAVEAAFSHLGRHPASGSPRYAHELDIPGLRAWPMKKFPYLVFYVEAETHVDVWRVLQAERDVPAWMQAG